MSNLVRWIIVALVALAATPSLADNRRVALIVANSRYTNATSLSNPGADARLIAASLKRAGFDSVDIQFDLARAPMESALRRFGATAEGADVALIYYAGHGIEAGGQNYLIPVDAKLERDRDLEIEATRLDTVLLMGEGARMRIIVLDACRNNPFIASMQRTMRTRSVGRGLAAVEPDGETLVVYAAKAGATAADGTGTNSPFAEALAKRIVQPGLEISLLFRSVRDDVLAKTGRTQEPFTYGSLSGNSFYFVKGTGAAPEFATAGPAVAPTLSGETAEALFWQGAMSANTETAFRAYLKKYPRGTFAELAQQNLGRFAAQVARVETRPPAPVTTPPAGGSALFGSIVPSSSVKNALTAPSASGRASVANFDYRPSLSVRKTVERQFVAQAKLLDPAGATQLETLFNSQDLFAVMQTELDKFGLKTTNVADALGVYLYNMWDVANGTDTNPTVAQARALQAQMAAALTNTPIMAQFTDDQKQEMAYQLMLQAAFASSAFKQAKATSAEQARQISDMSATNARTMYGLDLRALKFGNNGFSF